MRIAIKIIIGFILVAGLIIYWFFSKLTDVYSPTYNSVELISTKNQKLFIKSKNWGVTGDSQITIITNDEEREFEIDSTKQIISKGLEPFLYKVSNDTLFLTLRQKIKIPNGFNSNWIIIQNEVDNPTMMDLRHDKDFKKI